jgi:hypothetical protein
VCVARLIAVKQDEGANQGDGDHRHVDQEDALPSECLGQHAAEQDTNDQAGRTGTRPYRQRLVPLGPLSECGVDQSQRAGKHKRPVKALHRPADEQDLGLTRQSPNRRTGHV